MTSIADLWSAGPPQPTPPPDYALWKLWWYATLYGASPETRMRALDARRGAS